VSRQRIRRCTLALVPLLVVPLVLAGSLNQSAAVSSFSPNQELPLPLLAPIGPAPLAFIVRGLEPSTRVAPDGTVYVSSIRGVPGGVDLHRYYAPSDGAPNPDGTYPFKYEGQPDNCGIFSQANGGCAHNTLDPLLLAAGGGDVDIAPNFPPSGVPNLALVSLTLAPGITATHSTDRGDNFFSPPNTAAALIPVDDRQWIDGFGGQNVYLNYHDVGTFNIEVQRSNDGGLTYIDGFGEAIDLATQPAAGGLPPTNTANTAATIRVDRSACPSRGNLYQLFVAPDSAAENAVAGPPRSAYVGVSTDVKLGLSAFTFTDHKIATGAAGASLAQIFPAMAVDAFGNVYATWSDNTNIWYTFSTDLGTTWASPVVVNTGVTSGKANVFPWIDADANGHVGIVWLGADRVGNSNDRAVMEPGHGHPASQGSACDSGTTCMTTWASWNVYYLESVNGHSAPSFVQSQISDHPIHRGTVSTGGLGGGADRSLGDYFQIAFDRQHRANVAFSDDHKVSPVGPDNGADNPTTRRLIRANFTHELQPAGGILTTGTCAGTNLPPETGQKITGGGRLGPNVNFGFIAKDTPLNGALNYRDSGPNGADVKSSGGIDSLTFSGNCASFTGNAKVNGSAGYRFRVDACDNAPSGTPGDTFAIKVTGPGGYSYSNGGPLTEGNIQKH
jgi:hypothetical protein